MRRRNSGPHLVSDPLSGTVHDAGPLLTRHEERMLHDLIRRTHRVKNVNVIERQRLTTGQRFADAVAQTIGSWRFIVIQSIVLILWIVLNAVAWINAWDPYPFILLNLALSFQAAYSAPIIMMSQNRQASKDRLTAEHDYHINLKAELEIVAMRERLNELAGDQWEALIDLQRQQLGLLAQIEALSREVHDLERARSNERG
jgi:uncharacterized membrane protein